MGEYKNLVVDHDALNPNKEAIPGVQPLKEESEISKTPVPVPAIEQSPIEVQSAEKYLNQPIEKKFELSAELSTTEKEKIKNELVEYIKRNFSWNDDEERERNVNWTIEPIMQDIEFNLGKYDYRKLQGFIEAVKNNDFTAKVHAIYKNLEDVKNKYYESFSQLPNMLAFSPDLKVVKEKLENLFSDLSSNDREIILTINYLVDWLKDFLRYMARAFSREVVCPSSEIFRYFIKDYCLKNSPTVDFNKEIKDYYENFFIEKMNFLTPIFHSEESTRSYVLPTCEILESAEAKDYFLPPIKKILEECHQIAEQIKSIFQDFSLELEEVKLLEPAPPYSESTFNSLYFTTLLEKVGIGEGLSYWSKLFNKLGIYKEDTENTDIVYECQRYGLWKWVDGKKLQVYSTKYYSMKYFGLTLEHRPVDVLPRPPVILPPEEPEKYISPKTVHYKSVDED